MDDVTKQELFTKLGEMSAKLDGLKEDNTNQWNKMDAMDNRLRKQEVRTTGIAAGVSSFFALGIDAIKKGLGA